MIDGFRKSFLSMNAGGLRALTRWAECRRNIKGYRESIAPISQIEGEKKNKRRERMK